MDYGLEKKKEYNIIMEFRKINYLTLIYHYFTFNYTLGMYNKFGNESYYRKAKMNVFFPLFTSLNNLEGRPLHLKKRPFALYYYALFCRGNLRETFLPFSFILKYKIGVFKIFFKYSAKNNFYSKRRCKKKNYLNVFSRINIEIKTNLYLKMCFLFIFLIKNIFFSLKNVVYFLNKKIQIMPINYIDKLDNKSVLRTRLKYLLLYRNKMIKINGNMNERNKQSIKFNLFTNFYKYKYLKKSYVYKKKQIFF